MGCGSSSNGGGLHHVDDSVHVMLRHDRKVQQKKGGPALAYKERAAHPLLKPKSAPDTNEGGGNTHDPPPPAATAPRPAGNGPIAVEE